MFVHWCTSPSGERVIAYFDVLETPVGPLFVGGSSAGVHIIKFVDQRESAAVLVAELEAAAGEPATRDRGASAVAVRQLEEYFAGTRVEFDLPLAPRGTPFQLGVWAALRTIPPGETTSYGAIAEAIGKPSASRAVGAANGKNPISIVVPCHRVIGANGTLTGYGGGLPRKAWLLNHETSERSLLGGAR
ncbi:MAG: methylated-DNA--[protein]-cysteine S-methyltransferase [Chloroflexi bacterium]|nr:methylated-DNA--[protein]-cysteine S-methyltransferase [Chloroflexota bacterium]MDA1146603.1 methylated-DNA--[protein]-cysteine S-methyltransferase [Chloroflexota bacterium]